MIAILLFAHEPLASALVQVAAHPGFGNPLPLAGFDVPPHMRLEVAVEAARRGIEGLVAGGATEVLVLTDAFGATPCNAARQVATEDPRVRVVAGVNVPMLWRTVSSSTAHGMDSLVERAVSGGQQGVMHVPVPRQYNQPGHPARDDQERHHDQ